MSKNILEIYKEYKIMPNLQEHMLRVAAVASMICDNFTELLEKEEIITACLLHDMGNIIKFDLTKFPNFVAPEGMEYWQKVKDEYIEKYGQDEHNAHNKIAEELGVSKRVLELINTITFLGKSNTVLDNNYGNKIPGYCDNRVSPFGVVSLEERLDDVRIRYAHKGGDTPERKAFESAMREIEKQIFSKCKIKPEDINDETAAPIILELKKFVI